MNTSPDWQGCSPPGTGAVVFAAGALAAMGAVAAAVAFWVTAAVGSLAGAVVTVGICWEPTRGLRYSGGGTTAAVAFASAAGADTFAAAGSATGANTGTAAGAKLGAAAGASVAFAARA